MVSIRLQVRCRPHASCLELTHVAPVWQGETSRASWRGKLIVIEMIMNIAGFSLSNWVTYGFSYAAQLGKPVIFTDSHRLRCWKCVLARTLSFPVSIYIRPVCDRAMATGISTLAHGQRTR